MTESGDNLTKTIQDNVKEKSQRAFSLAKTETARNSFILFSGNFINLLLSMVAVIIVSRALGPHDFGVVATFNAILGTLVGLTEFGLSTAAVKLISEHLATNERRANVYMRVIYFMELASGVLVVALGLLFSHAIANTLGGPHLLFAVRMGFIAGAVTSAAAFFGPFFISHSQYVKNAVVNLSGGFFKAGSVIVMLALSILSLHHVIIAYTLTPILFFAIAFFFVPKGFLQKASREEEKTAAVAVFHYSKWVFLSYLATSIAGNLDTFLISRYHGSASVGIYTAAQQLISVMPLIIGAVTTVALPKLSILKTRREFESYMKKLVFGVSLLILAIAPGLLIAQYPIKIIFGDRYDASIGIFKILLVAYLIALFSNTIAVAIYARSRHKFLTYLNYAGLALTFIAYIILIPRFGPTGAATTYLISNIAAAGFIIWFTRKIIREIPE